MQAIAGDSNQPAENYRGYANSLVTTLSSLSPEQLAKVFPDGIAAGAGNTNDETSSSDDTTSDEENTSNTENETYSPPDDPLVDQPLIDLIQQDPPMPPERLEEALINQSPLSQNVLQQLVDIHGNSLPKERLTNLLMENSPLPGEVYLDILTGATHLNQDQLANLALAQDDDSDN